MFFLILSSVWFCSVATGRLMTRETKISPGLIIRWPNTTLVWFGFMVLNATFNYISAISWRSVLLVEETRGPGKTTDLPQVTDKLYHIMLYTSPWAGVKPPMMGTDCIGSCKSNYHTITAMMAPPNITKCRLPWTEYFWQVRFHLVQWLLRKRLKC